MGVVNRIIGVVNTKNGPLYVEEYYANGYTVKFTLTDNPEDAMTFGGASISGPGVDRPDGDCYGSGPNYKPLMSIRDALRSETMSYIGYKSVTVQVVDFNGNVLRTQKLPPRLEKYRGIVGKMISVVNLRDHTSSHFKAENGRKSSK